MIKLWLMVLLVSASSFAQAQPGHESSDSCALLKACNSQCESQRRCELASDTRDCTTKIFFYRLNDASCEAAKSAQNSVYMSQKSMCESLQSQEKSYCEADRGRCVAVASACSTLKAQPRAKKVEGAKVLWVDDNPDNNRHEREALSKLGAVVILSESTDSALKASMAQKIDLVISDFSRRDDPQAGYTLLDILRRTKGTAAIPYVIFSSSSTPSFISETKKRGAFGQTNRSTELLSLVVEALSKQ